MDLKIVIIKGESGEEMKSMGNFQISIPSNNTQRIQEGHPLVEHIICESLEAIIIELEN